MTCILIFFFFLFFYTHRDFAAFKVLEIPDESDEFALAEAVSHVDKLKKQETLLLGAINSQKKLRSAILEDNGSAK